MIWGVELDLAGEVTVSDSDSVTVSETVSKSNRPKNS